MVWVFDVRRHNLNNNMNFNKAISDVMHDCSFAIDTYFIIQKLYAVWVYFQGFFCSDHVAGQIWPWFLTILAAKYMNGSNL